MLHNNKLSKSLSIMAIFIFSLGLTNLFAGDNSKSSSKNIVNVAVEAGNFSTLVTALEATGLNKELQKEGPYTIFAPTDDAFAKLPEGTVEGLLKDKEALKSILLYHVVSGKVMAEDVVKINEATTASGAKLQINAGKNGVMINNSNVVTADINASNGVIHVIDTVLLPK